MKANVKSNTVGKFIKVLNGQYFDSSYTLVTEFFQNTQRAKAKELNISLKNGCLSFSDNGCGIKDFEDIITFDLSSWETTDEGFGIGFWSCLSVPNISKIKVRSNTFSILLDIDNIRNLISSELDEIPVEVETGMKNIKGFKVEIYSTYFEEKFDEYISVIKKEGSYMPYKVYLNEELIETKDIFKEALESTLFTKTYNTRAFKAVLTINNNAYCYPTLFYDKREVRQLYEYNYISGIIEAKKGAITLKEPDRKTFVYNDKSIEFDNKMKDCIKDLYKSFLKTLVSQELDDTLNKYDYAVSYYLTSKDYEKYLLIDAGEDKISSNETIVEDELENDNEPNFTEFVNKANIVSNAGVKIENSHKKITSTICDEINKNNLCRKKSLKKILQKSKSLFWIEYNNLDKYSDTVAVAEYYNIKVLKIKNQLFEKYLIEKDIPHISKLNDCIEKEFDFINKYIMTSKESSFLNLLQPIANYYKLPMNTFKIANIEQCINISHNGNIIHRKKYKNIGNNIKIYATASYNEICFDRKALSLKLFNINLGDEKSFNVGKNELKCLMYNLNTISHELAHLLYNTTDNTPNHFKKERLIAGEIIKLYI